MTPRSGCASVALLLAATGCGSGGSMGIDTTVVTSAPTTVAQTLPATSTSTIRLAPTAASTSEAPIPTTSPPLTVSPLASGPSQSLADAKRDGIVPAVADLALRDRVNPIVEQSTDEGLWVLSEIPNPDSSNCVLGKSGGVYGRDFICTVEYHEIVLLDAQATKIVQAYPFPGLPPYEMVVSPDAVYCARQGDGGLPDSMLCRIDRTTRTVVVRVFPWGGGSDPVSATAIFPTWTIDKPVTDAVYSGLSVIDGQVTTANGTAQFDPVSLERL